MSFENRVSDIKFRQTMKEYSDKQKLVVSPPLKLTPQKATPSVSKKRILSASRTLTFAKTAFPNLKSTAFDEPPILERFPSTELVPDPRIARPTPAEEQKLQLTRELSIEADSTSSGEQMPEPSPPLEKPSAPTIRLMLSQRRDPATQLTPFKAQPPEPNSLKRPREAEWQSLCDGWQYRWGRQRTRSLLDRKLGGDNGPVGHSYESVEVKADDGSEAYEVRVGAHVYYQYDPSSPGRVGRDTLMTVACVQLLYADADDQPRFKHDCYYAHSDMAADKDTWDLPEDPVPFHEEHELVYSPNDLDDSLELVDGLCSVKQISNAQNNQAVNSAIARCDREADCFFWRYKIS